MTAESTLYDVQTIHERVRTSGVVGAGGTGFPAHVKLQAQVGTFLVSAAKYKLVLRVSQQSMTVRAERLICGVRYAITTTGVSAGIIALKERYQRAIDILTPLLPTGIRLHTLPDVYPTGGEILTTWMVTSRRVPPTALPVDVGVMVDNVQTMLNIVRAVKQQHLITRRTLTINDAIIGPITFIVPIGMSLRDILALAGGTTVDDPDFVNGGSMMGGLIISLDIPISKTVGGLLVLPKSHALIRRRMQGERTMLSAIRTVCGQYHLCTDLCPRHLIDRELSPRLLVHTVSYRQVATPQLPFTALAYSEYSMREGVVHPVEISPIRINHILKRELRALNHRYEGPSNPEDETARCRLIPVKHPITKLDLSDWHHDVPLAETDYSIDKTTLLLCQYMGASAIPCVEQGERVVRDQCVADVSSGALGTPVYASIGGIIGRITRQSIMIIRG